MYFRLSAPIDPQERLERRTEMAVQITFKPGDEIEFHYIKSPQFRSFHADGVVGSLTPGETITIAFYNERVAIPTKVVHSLTKEGGLGPELESRREGKSGFARELDAVAILSLKSAAILYRWLGQRLKETKNIKDNIEGPGEEK